MGDNLVLPVSSRQFAPAGSNPTASAIANVPSVASRQRPTFAVADLENRPVSLTVDQARADKCIALDRPQRTKLLSARPEMASKKASS